MNKVLITCLLSLLISAPQIICAKVYYVAQHSSGNGSGDSYDNRADVGTHNAGKGNFGNLDGDIVVVCGEINTPIKVPDRGTSGNFVTYDGKGSTYDSRCQNAIITDFSSQNGYSSFYVSSKNYITVKNITIDWGYISEMGDTLDNKWGLRIKNSNNIAIESVNIRKTHNGIAIHDDSYDITVKRSVIEKIAETGIYLSNYSTSTYPHHVTIGGNINDGNVIKNCTFKSAWDNNVVGYHIRLGVNTENIVVSYNHMYSDLEYHGMSGMLVHSSRNILIENNTIHDQKSFNHRAGISIKGEKPTQLASNIVIRNNNIYNNYSDENSYADFSAAMVFSGNWEHIYVYGNNISSCGGGINVNFARWKNLPTHSDNINPNNMHIWSNVIKDTSDYAIVIDGYPSGTDIISNVNILNNTLYRVAKNAYYSNWSGIAIRLNASQINDINIKNNIIFDSRMDSVKKYSIFLHEFQNTNIQNNTGFYSKDVPDEIINNQIGALDSNDPKLELTVKGNIILEKYSLSIDSGIKLLGPNNLPPEILSFAGNFDYSYALDPIATDWTVIPPKVYQLRQTENGLGWEKRCVCLYRTEYK